MRRLVLAGLAVLSAQPALALSCLRPDVATSFAAASASDDVYTVVLGQLRFNSAAPPFDGTTVPEASVPAQFMGHALTPDGFTREMTRDVTLEVTCIENMQVCGSAGDPRGPVLAFLREAGGELVLDLDPCPQWLFPSPTAAQIETIGECATGGICAPGG